MRQSVITSDVCLSLHLRACVRLRACVCVCTLVYIFRPHFARLSFTLVSGAAADCGCYCLIRAGPPRRRPDKSIKLPLAVPGGGWWRGVDGDRFSLWRENLPRCTSSKWCHKGVRAEAACRARRFAELLFFTHAASGWWRQRRRREREGRKEGKGESWRWRRRDSLCLRYVAPCTQPTRTLVKE